MAAARRYAALLRAVNVGGRKLPMGALAEAVEALGHEDVRTYIQSGNVLLTARGPRAEVRSGLERAIEEQFGLATSVMLRTHEELVNAEAANPFVRADRSKLHVVFLDRAPAKAAIARLDPARSPSDETAVVGKELFLHLPGGAGRTKLTLGYLEKRLGVAGTQRNWNTLLKLIDLTTPAAAG